MARFRPFAAIALVCLTGLLAGCRDGISCHGRRLSLFVVPMYQVPSGYSSTYERQLEHAGPIVVPEALSDEHSLRRAAGAE